MGGLKQRFLLVHLCRGQAKRATVHSCRGGWRRASLDKESGNARVAARQRSQASVKNVVRSNSSSGVAGDVDRVHEGLVQDAGGNDVGCRHTCSQRGPTVPQDGAKIKMKMRKMSNDAVMQMLAVDVMLYVVAGGCSAEAAPGS